MCSAFVTEMFVSETRRETLAVIKMHIKGALTEEEEETLTTKEGFDT
jgi:hypothetical protein